MITALGNKPQTVLIRDPGVPSTRYRKVSLIHKALKTKIDFIAFYNFVILYAYLPTYLYERRVFSLCMRKCEERRTRKPIHILRLPLVYEKIRAVIIYVQNKDLFSI